MGFVHCRLEGSAGNEHYPDSAVEHGHFHLLFKGVVLGGAPNMTAQTQDRPEAKSQCGNS